MTEISKACIAGVVISAALFGVAKHANAESITGTSSCNAWTSKEAGELDELVEVGYSVGFADAYSAVNNTRRYRYGEIVAAITRECYRDPKQPIVLAAAKAMQTFVK